ncbi:MAG: glycosyltransferase [Fibrobacteres bacterium]|nr:glycosyltransferase [Fibrobacterota bacterium]
MIPNPDPRAEAMDPSIVSFVIPTLNEEKFLGICLRSISGLERPEGIASLEILVVDNFSKDATPDIARAAGARLIQQPPVNVSNSRNTGARAATGAYLAFIDADCELAPDWLVRCLAHLRRGDVCGAGTNISPPPPDAPWVEKYWYDLGYEKMASDMREVAWLPTFNLLVKRDVFLEVGGFNEKLVTCEDSDLGYKMSAKGRLVLENRVTTRHYRESKTIPEFFRRERWRGMGSLQSFFMHELNLGELPSLVFPVIFLVLLAVAVALTGAALLGVSDGSGAIPGVGRIPLWAAGLAWLGTAAGPFLQVIRKRILPWQGRRFAACFTLASVYLFARAIALAKGAARIS